MTEEEKKEYNKQWYIKNKERLVQHYIDNKEKFEQYYIDNKEILKEKRDKDDPENKRLKHRRNHLKRRYNITLEQYNKMLSEQFSGCSICSETIMDSEKDLCVDHDHETGKVRDLLCRDCNLLLGHANDSIEILLKAVEYLLKHKN